MANEAKPIYVPFMNFCKKLYDKRILKRKVCRSADEFIKEFKKEFPLEAVPDRTWVYKIAKSDYYEFSHKWFPSTKPPKSDKSKDEQAKPIKYNSIEDRPFKEWLRSFPGNYEIDSVIGKREDSQALLTMIDICTGKFYSAFYDRTMIGFAAALKKIIDVEKIKINTLTMDNGGENNLIHTVVDETKLYNCHAYCSGEKGTLENKHRIVRRVIPKGISLDNYSEKDLPILNRFINTYYSAKFNIM